MTYHNHNHEHSGYGCHTQSCCGCPKAKVFDYCCNESPRDYFHNGPRYMRPVALSQANRRLELNNPSNPVYKYRNTAGIPNIATRSDYIFHRNDV